jgi:hypothetical protein
MESFPSPAPDADEFYILKRGEILGPFTAAAIREGVERGEYSPDHFVQHGGLPVWQPLASSRFAKAAWFPDSACCSPWRRCPCCFR